MNFLDNKLFLFSFVIGANLVNIVVVLNFDMNILYKHPSLKFLKNKT